MAKFISIDELDLNFGQMTGTTPSARNCNSKCKGRSPGPTETQAKPKNQRNTNENKVKSVNSTSKAHSILDTCNDDCIDEESIQKNSPSRCSELVNRASTAFEKERKIWMGQNAMDQRRSSYTTGEVESSTTLPSQYSMDAIQQTCEPIFRPQARGNVYDIFEEKRNVEFDSPFSEPTYYLSK